MKTIRSWRRALLRRAAKHGESGQALAEIAIALPLLLLMLIGIWEFARAYQIQQVVVNAAREGARIVVLPNSSGGTVDSATNAINHYLAAGSISGASINITGTEDTGQPMTVQVSVPYSFNLIGPVIRLATGNDGGPGDITLSSQATMRHE
ncbi:MAG: TadE/TadG family type IV pilus assembly protein [Gemmatimonadota bacterium]